MSKAAQRKEKQQWALENPKLDNARKLRGNYFIDPDDKEFKETFSINKEQVGTSSGSRCARIVANPTKSKNQSMYAS